MSEPETRVSKTRDMRRNDGARIDGMRLARRYISVAGLVVVLNGAATLAPMSVEARDVIRIPIPSPDRVVRRARGLVHRAVGKITDNRPTKRSSSAKKAPVKPATDKSLKPGPEATLPPATEPIAEVAGRTEQLPAATSTVANRQPQAVESQSRDVAQGFETADRSIETTSPRAPAPATPPAGPATAKPVPGKNGMVYPPGEEESLATMIDVRDIPSGTLAKDPRTGKIFRVP
jgi:hypothetical protein